MERFYSNKSFSKLLKSVLVLKVLKIPGILRLNPRYLPKFIVKNTVYDHFCIGDDKKEILKELNTLSKLRVKPILDYSIEDYHERNYLKIIKSIRLASKIPNSFVSIKLTSLINNGTTEFDGIPDSICKICLYAKEKDVKILIDAEHSSVQKKIDKITLKLAKIYNSKGNLVVWNTYQMYLKDSYARLLRDTNNTNLGVKLVRGAYMDNERKELLHDNIFKTHENYDRAVRYCMVRNSFDCGCKDLGLMLATHNKSSIDKCIKTSSQILGNEIFFAQLYGMKDDITFELAERGFKVYKYIPYGPINKVIPYLSRRAQENSSIEVSGEGEILPYYLEIKNRISKHIKFLFDFFLKVLYKK